MTGPDYTSLVAGQRAYFKAGHTRPVSWRVEQLNAIKTMIDESRDAMYEALWHDLRRNKTEADLLDVDWSIREADYALDHLHEWMKPEHIPTPLLMKPGHVRVRWDPLGVTLTIGAWNEPYMLTIGPLVAAIAAGNTAVLKPSEICEACAEQLAEMVPRYLDTQAVAVAQGGIPETTALLAQKWDMIFFTGSPPVGKIVHQAAAQNLTPAVLELGGKNPTIVHSSAELKTAARRIAYGRFLNSGHVCTAPDHVLVWPDVKDEFVGHLQEAIRDFYGDDPKQSPDYGRVINKRNFDRLVGFLGSGTLAAGGETDPDELYIAPTVLVDVPVDSPIMLDEVFGPILPVLEIDSVEAVIDWINDHPRPLGLYVFTEDEDVAERILEATDSGDACVNDCAIHPMVPELPFGGVGNSGMGKYHGRWGFEAFTNARGVLHHSAQIDPGVMYPPYADHGPEHSSPRS
ncbi:MAG: aldehyde dehydrogenase family protein [Candidatus Limnocylindrales bacterium]